MTDEKYIQNQKDFILREVKHILRNHWKISFPILLLIIPFILLAIQFEHPDHWHKATITLAEVDFTTGRHGYLHLHSTDGEEFSVLGSPDKSKREISEQLVVGDTYMIIYADDFFRNTVCELRDGYREYVGYEASVDNYWTGQMICWGFAAVMGLVLVGFNLLIYFLGTNDRIKRIRKYLSRIKMREEKRQN